MHLIDKDPVPKGYKASSTPSVTPKKDSLATALRKKMSAPLTKAIRYFPKKHEDYKMKKSDEEAGFLKDYNAREQSGGAVQNSNKDRAIFKAIKERK